MEKPHIKYHPAIKQYSCQADGRLVFGAGPGEAYANFVRYSIKVGHGLEYLAYQNNAGLQQSPTLNERMLSMMAKAQRGAAFGVYPEMYAMHSGYTDIGYTGGDREIAAGIARAAQIAADGPHSVGANPLFTY